MNHLTIVAIVIGSGWCILMGWLVYKYIKNKKQIARNEQKINDLQSDFQIFDGTDAPSIKAKIIDENTIEINDSIIRIVPNPENDKKKGQPDKHDTRI